MTGIHVTAHVGRKTSDPHLFNDYLAAFFNGLANQDPVPYPEAANQEGLQRQLPRQPRLPIVPGLDLEDPPPSPYHLREGFFRARMFRSHRLEAFAYKLRSEAKFLREFKDAYGDGRQTTVFIGDWDSSRYTPRGQVTTKGKGFRQVLLCL